MCSGLRLKSMAWASRMTLGAVEVLCSRREHSSWRMRALVCARVGGIRTPAAERRRVVGVLSSLVLLVVMVLLLLLLLLGWLGFLGLSSSVDGVVLLWRRAW